MQQRYIVPPRVLYVIHVVIGSSKPAEKKKASPKRKNNQSERAKRELSYENRLKRILKQRRPHSRDSHLQPYNMRSTAVASGRARSSGAFSARGRHYHRRGGFIIIYERAPVYEGYHVARHNRAIVPLTAIGPIWASPRAYSVAAARTMVFGRHCSAAQ